MRITIEVKGPVEEWAERRSFGWEAQFLERGELFYSRGGFALRAQAIRSEAEREAIENRRRAINVVRLAPVPARRGSTPASGVDIHQATARLIA